MTHYFCTAAAAAAAADTKERSGQGRFCWVDEAKTEETKLVDAESGAPQRGRAKGLAKGTFAV